ncbi:MAG: efflux transporter outer membrane subunit [Acidobacteriaceae bacterium]|jgi:NodT family efflux transporter outer membrane factor (OMF) lipoprotein|nr:efflux transporter outer membrane subunit [Acidobacteriaceae bacterium]
MPGGASGVGRAVLAVAVLAVASACGPQQPYVAPQAVAPPLYKENATWKNGAPADDLARGAWWELFNDEPLNTLEARVAASNQTLKQADARLTAARAALTGARAALSPQVAVAPSITGARPSGNRAVSQFHAAYGDFLLPASVSYEADFWGRIKSSIAASRALAEATAADLETVNLSLHAELAGDYFALRGFDRERQLLDSTVTSYERALELTQNRFTGGLASQADVALAETQLETTRAQAVDLGIVRSALEHAIAVLVGEPASSFSLAQVPLADEPPMIPVGLPSALLERRPDIASAERRVAAAYAQMGVTEAAFYPIFQLTAAGGFESASLGSWISGLSNFWSIGPATLITVFDGGRRRAANAEARAQYDEAIAAYQQSVLVAFQEVEDQLSALRILSEEATIEQRAVDAAERSLQQATLRYRGGLASYLEVASAQSIALQNERTAVVLQMQRMTATVQLIKGLGGGWTLSDLPSVDPPPPAQPFVQSVAKQ